MELSTTSSHRVGEEGGEQPVRRAIGLWPPAELPRVQGSLARAYAPELPKEYAGDKANGAEGAGGVEAWPADVRFILTALETGRAEQRDAAACHAERLARPERRARGRSPWRTVAHLRLLSHSLQAAAVVIYTRDLAPRSLGFITRHRLPLGYGAKLHVRAPSGRDVAIDCVVHRCRETVLGWYEGAVSFNREQLELVEGVKA